MPATDKSAGGACLLRNFPLHKSEFVRERIHSHSMQRKNERMPMHPLASQEEMSSSGSCQAALELQPPPPSGRR